MAEDDLLHAIHADPWSDRALDLPALNAPASDAIEQAIEGLRPTATRLPEELRSGSLVILGPPGTGKTHLFSRLRKRLGPRAIFVHIRPLLHGGLTPAFVLREVVLQLGNMSHGNMQVDALVGSALGQVDRGSGQFPLAFLTEYKGFDPAERTQRLETAVEAILAAWTDLDDVFLERLLQVPFVSPRERRALLAWLAGEDCDPSQLARIGATSSLSPERTVRALRTLSCVASLGAPLVVVFDQLENLVTKDGIEERITQYANLVSELVDATRGLLVVQLALDTEWVQAIEPALNLSQRSRVSQRKISVSLPSPAQAKALVGVWYAALDRPLGPAPWPFTTAQLDRLADLPGLTPRMLLVAFHDAKEGVPIGLLEGEQAEVAAARSDLVERLDEEWHEALTQAHFLIDQAEGRRGGIDPGRFQDGLARASALALHPLRATNSEAAAFETGVGDWVAFLHHAHPKSVGAALDRLLELSAAKPGIIYREAWREFPTTWRATHEKVQSLLGTGRVRWLALERSDVARLLALDLLMTSAYSRDIEDARGRVIESAVVEDYVRENLRPGDWPPVAALHAERENRHEANPMALPPAPAPVPRVSAAPPATAHPSAAQDGPEHRAASIVHATLERLRVASLDRIVREVVRVDASLSRASVVEALDRRPDVGAIWLGRNIVTARSNSD